MPLVLEGMKEMDEVGLNGGFCVFLMLLLQGAKREMQKQEISPVYLNCGSHEEIGWFTYEMPVAINCNSVFKNMFPF